MTPDGAACPEPVFRVRNGVPMCAGHHEADVKAQKSETNAKYAASARLTKPQAQALRDGLAVLAEATVDHSAATVAYEATVNDPAVDDRFHETREAVVGAVQDVLADLWEALPEALLPPGYSFTYVEDDADDADDADGTSG